MEKFMIYYEPENNEKEGELKSFTYVAEPVGKEFKLKVVEEIYTNEGTEKFKLKEMHNNLDEIFKKIKEINFNIKTNTKERDGVIIIKYGENKLVSNSLKSVSSIIDKFKVKELLNMTSKELLEIKNLKEFVCE